MISVSIFVPPTTKGVYHLIDALCCVPKAIINYESRIRTSTMRHILKESNKKQPFAKGRLSIRMCLGKHIHEI